MKPWKKCVITIAASAAIWALPSQASAQDKTPDAEEIVPGNAVWNLVPTIPPQSARVTFVSGNPYLPEKCTVEFWLPDK